MVIWEHNQFLGIDFENLLTKSLFTLKKDDWKILPDILNAISVDILDYSYLYWLKW